MNIKQRVSEIFAQEAQAISSIPVTDEFEHAANLLKDCNGKVLTTGMGKAGHIANKFSATLCSTGTPASFLHPGEAAHGDLGLIEEKDAIVAFSTSGKTREVLDILAAGRELGLHTVIGITSHPDSTLRELSDVVIDMGVIKEACRLELTPTSSMAVMLAISDALALLLMELKGFDADDFGKRHHGGYLGQKARNTK
ncbi:MAG: SIS domain-containing protein [Gammaproteobacteria bacterium]|jgi:arabinose-5-phosphate isomerase|nr:SIS domain-containing protein [Gammaproteobacteria bacterium]